MNKRDFVLPEDIKNLAHKVLAHRLILTYEAIADQVSAKEIIDKILDTIPV
jgi:MoxR-like ATPase